MVHYDDSYVRGATTVSRVLRRVFGIACLIAVPGIWIAVQGALPEARIMGLGLSVIVMGLAGLCLFGR
ncbi:hypothetical protein [Marivita sp. XM-24bin2]|jgi:hypothetical protein|uniref:hypothetical protein n=1 Tax=unclassified Marivita TaxID=2632480 RepID=UPI000D794989|nr:hypothetical protein [Marivita sp. XM-24bin2]MCR9108702.1 hypothetical protein [Paracoccaceae bacterium]PWL34176.1 MAG: hypothetical protein DCO97_15805 [Marivita sp. XM-24bin2]